MHGEPFIEGNSQCLQKARGTKGDPSCRTRTHTHTQRGQGCRNVDFSMTGRRGKTPGKSTKRLSVGFWLKAERCFPGWVKFGGTRLAWLRE